MMDRSPVNLKKALRLLFAFEEITCLTDEQNTDPMVKWLCLDVSSGRPGDVLLLPVGDVNLQSLKEANEKGIEVVLLIGQKRDLKDVSFPLPAFLLETDQDIRQVQQKLAQFLINQQEVLNEKKLQIYTRLTRLAADGAELSGLARAMSEITRHSVLIHDKRLNIIAEIPSTDLHPFWENITEQLSKKENLPTSLRDRQKAGEHELGIFQMMFGSISRVIAPITVGEVARGYLSIIASEDTLDTLDRIVAEAGASICAVEMSRTKSVRETEKKLQSDLLTALLQENLSPRDAKLWMDAIGLDQNQAHAALQFAWDSPGAPSRRRLETLLNGEIARMRIKVILNPAGEAVICFCQIPKSENGFQIALEFAQQVFEQAVREYPDIPIRCGVGSPAEELNYWHHSFKEAGLALDLATRLGRNQPLYYPDLSVYRLLLLLEDKPELHVFQQDVLGSLLSHENRDQLIETLEAYFEQNGNLSQTAEALYIHRNTLSYRLGRIAEISGLDLNHPEIALAVQLALKINRLMRD